MVKECKTIVFLGKFLSSTFNVKIINVCFARNKKNHDKIYIITVPNRLGLLNIPTVFL